MIVGGTFLKTYERELLGNVPQRNQFLLIDIGEVYHDEMDDVPILL